MKVKFFGHACWLIEGAKDKVIIDPFLTNNPHTETKPADLEVDYILVTHAHGDHMGAAQELAQQSDATIITTNEIANMLSQKGFNTHGMHVGGAYEFSFGKVKAIPAFHGSGIEGGHACGYLLTMGEKTIYHAGDTSLFGDMKLLNGIWAEKVDLALLPIGDNFTMGPEDAAVAAKWIDPEKVVPMHYGTFSLIDVDPTEFVHRADAENVNSEVIVLKPDESLEI